MALLPILRYPDPRLHTVAKPVKEVDDRIRQLADDMLETMRASDGVGLAATQVDVHERVIVMDTSETHDQPRVLINPEIIERSAEMMVGDEGCLSVPSIYDKVERHARVKVRALGRDGQPYEFEAEGLTAVCVQHEMDHLMGKVFVEYLSPLKRNRIKSKMLKKTREEER
ncbi:peptide deformylase [Aquincola tertiaricarbonis]|uniref:Peptide deformylase n=1 Tax=Aquincola tertiaricarbonis TaxID=391953 RepID=A0ABY4S918_AQUTE|nr:peptide deformylase [Aquincola tertiaricarbonis]URI09847.1 peptide deformylase [Aquincola tertiaricarbonis]